MIEEQTILPSEVLKACRQAQTVYNYLVFIAALDYPEKNIIELVYYLRSMAEKKNLALKVELSRDQAEVASVADIWPAAEWHEREIFDLFGVNFSGHPDLRRILLPPEWEGFPLRKDYNKPGMIKRPETIK